MHSMRYPLDANAGTAMRIINFYIRSRNMVPHVDQDGAIHVPISEWDEVLKRSNKGNGWRDRAIIPNYPTNGHSPCATDQA